MAMRKCAEKSINRMQYPEKKNLKTKTKLENVL